MEFQHSILYNSAILKQTREDIEIIQVEINGRCEIFRINVSLFERKSGIFKTEYGKYL